MTEDEAREKWCPLSRTEYGATAVNRSGGVSVHNSTRCFASKCMIWVECPSDKTRGICGLIAVGCAKF
jgi:hypothetical protein